jgi:hypothetical protein
MRSYALTHFEHKDKYLCGKTAEHICDSTTRSADNVSCPTCIEKLSDIGARFLQAQDSLKQLLGDL